MKRPSLIFILSAAVIFCAFLFFGCLFAPATIKDSNNYVLTKEMTLVNTSRKEKIKKITIYARDSGLFEQKGLLLDTTFQIPVDEYKIQFNRDSLNLKFVNIFIILTRKPGLFLDTKPGDFVSKRKLVFETDYY